MKAIFVYRLDGKIALTPFIGYRAETLDDFKEIVKKYYNKETGYPGLYFSTSNKDVKVVFSGHQYEHGEGGRWTIFHEGDTTPGNWQPLTEELFNLFEDASKIDAKINMFSKIVHANNGIEVKVL